MTKIKAEHPTPLHWFLLFLCIISYIVLNIIIIFISLQDKDFFLNISRYTISGILAQAQVLAVLFIALNPIKKSHWFGYMLCGMSIVITLLVIISSRLLYALPGVITPIISVFICIAYTGVAEPRFRRVVSHPSGKSEPTLRAMSQGRCECVSLELS